MAGPGLGGGRAILLENGEWGLYVGRWAQLHWAGVAGPVHAAAAQSKQASKESRVEMWRCGISAAEFWGSHDDMNYGVDSVSTLAKTCFIFGFWKKQGEPSPKRPEAVCWEPVVI